MKREDYNDFYDKVIKKCIIGIKEYADKRLSDSSCLTDQRNARKRIFKNYQNKRDFVISNYMSKTSTVALDRHKVAACMIYAILKAKPLKVNRMIANLPEKILLCNEYLAFFVALNIIEMYKKDELLENGITDDYEIIIPKSYHEDDTPNNTYESNLCKSLYYISMTNVKQYDVFAYADILFLLEKYTDTYIELVKTQKNLKE